MSDKKKSTSCAKEKTGRKTVMTKEVLGKLEEAFSMDCSDAESCLHANISPDTLYSYQKQNPEFSERKRLLRQKLILKARRTVMDNLTDIKVAQWYLERKLKNEFSIKYIPNVPPDDEPSELDDFHKKRVAEILMAFGED